MKTCKRCNRIVDIETIICPACDGHDFKLNAVKICPLCGKVNRKSSSECELCKRSFSKKGGGYELANIMELVPPGERLKQQLENIQTSGRNKTPYARYVAIKEDIEMGENEDRCAFFIPGELEQRPIVLLPSFNESEKVNVYLVLSDTKSLDKMEKIEISKEEDINALNVQKKPHRKTNIASFVLFWLNLAMLCAFGLKMIGDVLGLQVIYAGFGGNNAAGQSVINAMEATSSFGSYAHLIYPILLGLIALEVILALIFVKTKATKGKKVFLIMLQSFIFVFAIGAYLISFLMIRGAEWQNIEAGMILLLTCALAGVLISIFYQYSKTKNVKEQKVRENPAETRVKEAEQEMVSLGEDFI